MKTAVKPQFLFGAEGKYFRLGFVISVLALALAPLTMSTYSTYLLSDALILGMLALSVGFLVGYVGLLSFGHAAFYGLGAYMLSLPLARVLPIDLPIWVSVPLILTIPTAYGAFVGYFSIKRRGIYFAILTLAFAEVMHKVIFYTTWTVPGRGNVGGANGIQNLPGIGGYVMTPVHQYYYLVLFALVVSYLTFRRIANSPFGRVLQGIRENEQRIRFLGYNVESYKIIAFTISAFFAGVPGALTTGLHQFSAPEMLEWTVSGEALIAAFIGGTGTLLGPIVGGVFLVYLIDWLSRVWPTGYLLYIGLAIVIVILFSPRGIVGSAIEIAEKKLGLKRINI